MTVREVSGFLVLLVLLAAMAVVHPATEFLLLIPTLAIVVQWWFGKRAA